MDCKRLIRIHSNIVFYDVFVCKMYAKPCVCCMLKVAHLSTELLAPVLPHRTANTKPVITAAVNMILSLSIVTLSIGILVKFWSFNGTFLSVKTYVACL